MKPQSKHYNRLTGNERFRLALAAMARGDEAEAAALGDTCPSYQYAARDWSFHRRVEASLQMMTTLALELAPHLAVIRELDWQAEQIGELMDTLALTGFDAAIEAHWGTLDPEGSPDNRHERGLPMPDVERIMQGAAGTGFAAVKALQALQDTRRGQAAHAVSMILAGFDAFAHKHWGLSAGEAIAAHAELFADLDDALLVYDAGRQADGETRERIGGRFEVLWAGLSPSA